MARPAAQPHSPKANQLLAALPEASYARLLPFLELLEMPLGLSVYESGGVQGFVDLTLAR